MNKEFWQFLDFTMDLLDEECYDMSWLTQEQSLKSQKASFELLKEGEEESDNLFSQIFGENGAEGCGSQIVSLEENVTIRSGRILYDDVVVEDISSDEEVDNL